MAEKTSKNVDDGKACAILAYFLIGIIWYFADEKMRKNTFVKFHTKQALVLLIFSIIISVVDMILAWIPFLGWLIMIILNIVVLVLWLFGLINAINGNEKEIPVIGTFAKNFTF